MVLRLFNHIPEPAAEVPACGAQAIGPHSYGVVRFDSGPRLRRKHGLEG